MNMKYLHNQTKYLPNQTSFIDDEDLSKVEPAQVQNNNFVEELQNLLNRHSIENESDTPDWILAEYIRKTLEAWNDSVLQRDKWYGHKTLTRDRTNN
jgi:hypothetical protein